MPTLIDTPEFAAAKDALQTAVRALEEARKIRLTFMQECLQIAENVLQKTEQRAMELRSDAAKYRAEIARLEATTGGDILREAMQSQPEAQSAASVDEPFITGLPPEALRKVWPEWEVRPTEGSGNVVFLGNDAFRFTHWRADSPEDSVARYGEWVQYSFRPHGATRAHVEALAQQAQTPKPHACPRCDRVLRQVEVTHGPYDGEIWRLVAFDEKADVFTLTRDARTKRVARTDCRFIAPAVPPQSEWCDGSGKGGAE